MGATLASAAYTINIFVLQSYNQGPICRGGIGGFNTPNDFFDPPSLRRLELLGGVDSNPGVSVTC